MGIQNQPGVACFNPNSDNNKIAAGDHAKANAIWLKRWREMLNKAHQTGGSVVQLFSQKENLSDMQEAEADMAADKKVPVKVITFSAVDEGDIARQLQKLQLA